MSGLRVLAGPSPKDLRPLVLGQPYHISSDLFDGDLLVHIKGIEQGGDEYFERPDRKEITWSMQMQGRFLKPVSANDLLFGNVFERSLKLPWGSSAALKFMSYIDPTLEHDLGGPKPWALSPLISSMPHLVHSRADIASPSSDHGALLDAVDTNPTPRASSFPKIPPAHEGPPIPEFPSKKSIDDDISLLYLALCSNEEEEGWTSSSTSSSASSIHSTASKGSRTQQKAQKKKEKRTQKLRNLKTATDRRSYFSDAKKRKEIIFGPEDVLTTDFCYGFLEFSPTLRLRIPGGITFDLLRYWDGQPVTFICCSKQKRTEESFWCICIEPGAEDEISEEGIIPLNGLQENKEGNQSEPVTREATMATDDVD